MKPDISPSTTGPSPSTLEDLPLAAMPPAERSHAIRAMVSLAMEDLEETAPLSPMPVPRSSSQTPNRPTKSTLSPLPTPSAPFETCS